MHLTNDFFLFSSAEKMCKINFPSDKGGPGWKLFFPLFFLAIFSGPIQGPVRKKMGIENGKKMESWAGGDEHQRGQCVARLPRSKRLAVLLLRTEDVNSGQQETGHTLEEEWLENWC